MTPRTRVRLPWCTRVTRALVVAGLLGLSLSLSLCLCLSPTTTWADEAPALAPPSAARQQALVHIVRQDCGSCHGMRLTGGLGPALTASALADRPVPALVATILVGRPGTPMPGWRGMLDERDARWIAQQLLRGFPEEGSTR